MNASGPGGQNGMSLARMALQKRQPLVAIVHLRGHLTQHPGDGEALELLGISYWQAGNHRSALQSLRESVEMDPRRPSAHYNYALLLSEQSRLDEARDEVQAA